RQGAQGREAAGRRSARAGGDRLGVFEARLAQVAMQVDEAGRHDKPRRVDDRLFTSRGALDEASILDEDVRDIAWLVATVGRIPDPSACDADHAGNPLSRYSNAMRTATPLVTCVSMTDWAPRATRGSISTPSFIGPGCMINAPGLARARR